MSARGCTELLVIAKEPVAGRVKTRLCPPFSPAEAAELAAASLADTLETLLALPARRRVLVLDGRPGDWVPPGFEVVPQSGGGLDERLAAESALQRLTQELERRVGERTVELERALAGLTQAQAQMATVIRAAQAVSGEIVLDDLLDQLMRLTLEHADARKCVLVLSREPGGNALLPSRGPRLRQIAHRVFVEAGSGALAAGIGPGLILNPQKQ